MEAKRYNFECYWSQQDGWHFTLGKKIMWASLGCFIVATIVIKYDIKCYEDHQSFDSMEDALYYMRVEYDKDQNP